MDDNVNPIFHMNLTDIDLNQEPTFQSLLNQLDSAHERVEARIRQLEAAEERQRQEQNPAGIRLFPDQTTASVNNGRSTLDDLKLDGSHLVAKALETNSDAIKAGKEKDLGSFYDCNICLDMATNPILTCCGHLFCWPCFYQVSNVNSSSKECPVCKGEVSENAVTPIYGNGGESERVIETESGSRIPPRPRARRVESIRQQIATHSLNELAIEEAIRQIRASLGETVGQEAQGGEGGVNANNESGFSAENGDSLSSLSSVLSGADRLIEELEMVINSRRLRDDMRASGVPEPPVGHPYSLRGRRRRNAVPRELGEGGRGNRESRRRRLN